MDASTIAAAIVQSGYLYDTGEIYYNKYFSPVKYELTILPLFTKTKVEVRHILEQCDILSFIFEVE